MSYTVQMQNINKNNDKLLHTDLRRLNENDCLMCTVL